MTTAIPAEAGGSQLLRLDQLRARLGLSRAMIWRLVQRGELAQPLCLSARVRAWKVEDAEAFIASRERRATDSKRPVI